MPANDPLTNPDVASIVAIEVLLLVQLPPVAVSLSVVVAPAHTLAVPVMAEGNACTVTVTISAQPVTGKV